MVTPEEIRALSENPKKNRYKNVPCLDCTRVKLKGNNEYIHANYVQSASNPKRFICTQGPLSATANDFWRMIAQEKVESIIMLCNVVEEGVRKCDEYFPTSEHNKKIYDDISIELIKAVDTASADSKWIVISDIKMQWS
ncbi:unnamed protein product, partial [Toxocara canis]|uniref:Tyrosine-protein phosphatase domain-containing protein n=1 Tax=Toxocara canis TaxID=6265 RepID=A0A183V8U1_TOXCA